MITKTCNKHGDNSPAYEINESRGTRLKCKKCVSEAVVRRQRKVKKTLVDEAGGSCSLCGYDRCQQALQFHHLDPSTKEFSLGTGNGIKSMKRMRKEASKCVLLCGNCHVEVENGITSLGSLTQSV